MTLISYYKGLYNLLIQSGMSHSWDGFGLINFHYTFQGGENGGELGTLVGLLGEEREDAGSELEAFILPLPKARSLGWRSLTVTDGA